MGTFRVVGNAASRGYDKVNAALRDIMRKAAERSPYDVEVFSGKRFGGGKSRHDTGKAVDVVLRDPVTGQAIPNLGSQPGFEAYQGFANVAKGIQQADYPALNDQFRWGGYFGPSGLNPKGFDLMHFDLKPGAAMAYGTFSGGLNTAGIEAFGNLGAGMIYSANGQVLAPNNASYANLWTNPGFAASDIPTPPAEVGGIGTRTLKKGRSGEDVAALQETLAAAGFYKGDLDGRFGKQTEQALKDYQASINRVRAAAGAKPIAEDGVLGAATREHLADTVAQQTSQPNFGEVFDAAKQGLLAGAVGPPGGPSAANFNATVGPPDAPVADAQSLRTPGPLTGPLTGSVTPDRTPLGAAIDMKMRPVAPPSVRGSVTSDQTPLGAAVEMGRLKPTGPTAPLGMVRNPAADDPRVAAEILNNTTQNQAIHPRGRASDEYAQPVRPAPPATPSPTQAQFEAAKQAIRDQQGLPQINPNKIGVDPNNLPVAAGTGGGVLSGAAPPRDPAGFAIDTSRPSIKNPDGSFSTEISETVQGRDGWYNRPTIGNTTQAQGPFPSKELAESAAIARSGSIAAARAGVPIEPIARADAPLSGAIEPPGRSPLASAAQLEAAKQSIRDQQGFPQINTAKIGVDPSNPPVAAGTGGGVLGQPSAASGGPMPYGSASAADAPGSPLKAALDMAAAKQRAAMTPQPAAKPPTAIAAPKPIASPLAGAASLAPLPSRTVGYAPGMAPPSPALGARAASELQGYTAPAPTQSYQATNPVAQAASMTGVPTAQAAGPLAGAVQAAPKPNPIAKIAAPLIGSIIGGAVAGPLGSMIGGGLGRVVANKSMMSGGTPRDGQGAGNATGRRSNQPGPSGGVSNRHSDNVGLSRSGGAGGR